MKILKINLKAFLFLFFILSSNLSFSQILERTMFLEEKIPSRNLHLKENKQSNIKNKKILKKGSLPIYMRKSEFFLKTFKAVKNKFVALPIGQKLNLKVGDILPIKIEDNLLVYKSSSIFVRAIIEKGKFKESVLVGKAIIKNKRVSISFHSINPIKDPYSYNFQGILQDSKGQEGIKGHYRENPFYMFLKPVLESLNHENREIRTALKATKRYLKNIKQDVYIEILSPIYGKVLVLEKPIKIDQISKNIKTNQSIK